MSRTLRAGEQVARPLTRRPPAQAAGGPRQRRALRRALREALAGYGFAAPYLVLFAVFLAGPIIASLVVSFTDFSLGNIVDPASARFVGLENYRQLVHDQTFVSGPRTPPTSCWSGCRSRSAWGSRSRSASTRRWRASRPSCAPAITPPRS